MLRVGPLLKNIPIYLLHSISGKITHLHLLMPLLGPLEVFKSRKVPFLFLIFIASFIPPFLYSLFGYDFPGVKNAIVTSLQCLFAYFLMRNYSKDEMIQLAKIGIIFFALYFFYEILSTSEIRWKRVFGGDVFYLKGGFWGLNWYHVVSGERTYIFKIASIGDFVQNLLVLPNLQGIQGFSNHSGFSLMFFTHFFSLTKNRRWSIFSFLMILLTGSRGAILLAIGGLVALSLSQKYEKCFLPVVKVVIFSTLLSPLLLLIIESALNDQSKLLINKISSNRYAVQQVFLEISKENLLGLGVNNSHKHLSRNLNKGSSISKNGLYQFDKALEDQGPHNLFLKILCENGLLGYSLFCGFYFRLFILFLRDPNKDFLVLLSILSVSFVTYNGIFEFVFYFMIAYQVVRGKVPLEMFPKGERL